MRRLGGLWEQVVSFDNLLLAYRRARRGKRRRPAIAQFALDLERELLSLQQDLVSRSYRPGPYRRFTVYERKPRLIAAAPFRDRVVHHALMAVVEPLLDRTFIDDSYACRRGKGTHAAVARYQAWANRYTYAIKLDVAQYFASVDRGILKEKLRRRLKDPQVLALFNLIIETGPNDPCPHFGFPGDVLPAPSAHHCGLPIGNLTSQFLANLYLDDLDHHLKEGLRVTAYLRYVDDLFVLADDKGWLAEVRERVAEVLAHDRLRLRPRPVHPVLTRAGLDVLGYRVFPGLRRLRPDNGHRFARRLRALARAYAAGRVGWAQIDPAVQSWIGHARHADTAGLRRALFAQARFQRGNPSRQARST